MIDDIKEKEKEIKKIWLEYKDEKGLKQIFQEYLGEYFDVSDWNPRVETQSRADWFALLNMTKRWKKKIEETELEDEMKAVEEMNEEGVDNVQDKNRKRMVIILRKVLKMYERSPNKLKNINITQIQKLYQTIQSLEERKQMTNIQKGKLHLEAVRTLLPYNRLSIAELTALRGKINASFQEVINLKSGEGGGDGQPATNNG